MQLSLSPENVNTLIKRLDFEVVTGLNARLGDHVEIEIVQPHRLGAGIIFAAQADNLRIELMTACVPIISRTSHNYAISSTGFKYLVARYERSERKDQWQLDLSYGERGYQSFGLATFDVDSVDAAAGMIANHILHDLSPLYA